MAHLLFLGLQIFFGVLAGLNFAGNPLHNFHSGLLQGFNLFGIVRQQPHTAHAQGF